MSDAQAREAIEQRLAVVAQLVRYCQDSGCLGDMAGGCAEGYGPECVEDWCQPCLTEALLRQLEHEQQTRAEADRQLAKLVELEASYRQQEVSTRQRMAMHLGLSASASWDDIANMAATATLRAQDAEAAEARVQALEQALRDAEDYLRVITPCDLGCEFVLHIVQAALSPAVTERP